MSRNERPAPSPALDARCRSPLVLSLLFGYGLLQISSNLIHHDHHLHVNAAQVNLAHQINHDKDREIITLNATNFNAQLIQYQHPFPHIKVVEYYLPYCGICRKFKQTFLHLSKDIYSWRNVIRLAQLDMAVSFNAPIVQSWSIDTVPTLRIHPTLDRSLAEGLNRQLVTRSRTMKDIELQRLMYQEYTAANLMTRSLNVVKYTNGSGIEDKVSSLKQDLMRYVQHFVKEHPNDIPSTWPNFKPVTEKTLAELKRSHPRKELFLIVESDDSTQTDSHNDRLDLGFQIMMELSSSAAWKAIRYVRVSDDKELIEDVMSFKKKELQERVDSQSTDQLPAIQEQIDLLEALIQGKHNQSNNLILIHIDDSYSLFGHSANTASTKFPFLEVITSQDFVAHEQLNLLTQETSLTKIIPRSLHKRTLDEDMNNLNLTRKIELAILYINQTYTPTQEDKEFTSALRKFDENPTSYSSKREASDRLKEIQKNTPMSLALYHTIIMAICLSFLIVLLRCASYYIERQRRHKASMLNGVQYSGEPSTFRIVNSVGIDSP